MIVADTNLLAYLVIDGEHTATAHRLRVREPNWKAPTLWRAEFLNVLHVTMRHGLMSMAQATHAWYRACDVMRGNEVEIDGLQVLEVAARDGIAAYDAQFVALAEGLGVPLLSFDRPLLARCGVASSPAEFLHAPR